MTTPLREFGEYLRSLRVARNLPLRRFCQLTGLDPGNVSKMERGLLQPPTGERLDQLAESLGLKEGTDERTLFNDLAYSCRGEIPPDILNDEELVARLPVVFRTLRGEPLGEDELKALAEKIRRS